MKSKLAALLVLGLSVGCDANVADESASLLAVHEKAKRAHVETDVAALLENMADEFVAVSNGQIFTQTKSEVEAFFTQYFAGASYAEYVDAEPPIVRVSADGTMGWVISRIRATRTETDADGSPPSAASSTPASCSSKSETARGSVSPTSPPSHRKRAPRGAPLDESSMSIV